MNYGYPMQKFSEARRCLMLPHPEGEIRAMVLAMYHSRIGLEHVPEGVLEEPAAKWALELGALIKREKGRDPCEIAEELSFDERLTLSGLIDQLADYFHLECLGRG